MSRRPFFAEGCALDTSGKSDSGVGLAPVEQSLWFMDLRQLFSEILVGLSRFESFFPPTNPPALRSTPPAPHEEFTLIPESCATLTKRSQRGFPKSKDLKHRQKSKMSLNDISLHRVPSPVPAANLENRPTSATN
jgi:hypothetical protein